MVIIKVIEYSFSQVTVLVFDHNCNSQSVLSNPVISYKNNDLLSWNGVAQLTLQCFLINKV